MTLPLLYLLIYAFLTDVLKNGAAWILKAVTGIGLATVSLGLFLAVTDQATNYEDIQITPIRTAVANLLIILNLWLYTYLLNHIQKSVLLSVFNNFAGTIGLLAWLEWFLLRQEFRNVL
jgi:hypothetical protein